MEARGHDAPAPLFRLLGPVVLEAGAGRVTFTGKQGALLTVLLLHAGQVVSTPRLAETVWDPPMPSAPAARVRMLVSEVRRACAAVGADVIETRRPGYLLSPGAGGIDLTLFRSQVALAREAAAAGRHAEALAHYERALSWWRGAPLDGVTGSFAEARAERLHGLKLDALEERQEVLLTLDRYGDVVSEVSALADEAPLRERLHGQLMRALYESGRRTEALEVYRRLRRRMVDELGLEPTYELRRLQSRILRSDPPPVSAGDGAGPPGPDGGGPQAGAPAAARPAVVLPVPCQLPAPPPSFTNRDHELEELDDLRRPGTDGVGVAAISGPGGIGKTWLALHWAHARRDRYPDGQLYVNLRGFDEAEEPVPPGTVLRQFLGALGMPDAVIPTGQEAQAALYRSLLADRRLLVVLDNARDSAQVTSLIPGSPGCTVLVTSRNPLTALHTTHSARLLKVGAFSEEESRRMLRRHLGADRMAADPGAVAALVEHSGGLPLALGVLTSRAATDPGFPLAALTQELRDPATRLDALETGDLGAGLRAVFRSSYAALDATSARLFLLLGSAPGPDVGLAAAAVLAGLPMSATRTLLSALEAAGLVRRLTPARYWMHDLVRLYAAERAALDLPARELGQALSRLVETQAATACAADRLLSPHRLAVPSSPAPLRGVSPPGAVPFADAAAALAWFEAELPGLTATQLLAEELGLDQACWRLAWGLTTFLLRRYLTRERLGVWTVALAAARRIGDLRVLALCHWQAGYAYAHIGADRLGEGLENLNRALELFEQAGDRSGQAQVHHTVAWVWSVRGQPERGLEHARAALRIQHDAGDLVWEANALSALGWIHLQLGEHETARELCEQALTLFRHHHDESGEAATLDTLGGLALRQGAHERALDLYEQCLAVRAGNGNAFQAADTLVGLGDTHHALGQTERAHAAWSEALALYESQHRRDLAERVRSKLLRPGSSSDAH
ncbi:AfsR/SARP family transcriptional regulator [Nonomuraea wenchangensis]|uniref:DNA-binding transcriptional activator of the SARP family n=1 Tax=Nonomuraea wenchangensis TaxID=568860 RepID=A0A1I0KX00_9ACTN|nr:BTAD domain-containing putative transcriptional regulator [Nonomuraea wenchangensis]SEU30163.1 DNA-binding transcriptional activator of the SARP family [Nonomuraea wenchangensis]